MEQWGNSWVLGANYPPQLTVGRRPPFGVGGGVFWEGLGGGGVRQGQLGGGGEPRWGDMGWCGVGVGGGGQVGRFGVGWGGGGHRLPLPPLALLSPYHHLTIVSITHIIGRKAAGADGGGHSANENRPLLSRGPSTALSESTQSHVPLGGQFGDNFSRSLVQGQYITPGGVSQRPKYRADGM